MKKKIIIGIGIGIGIVLLIISMIAVSFYNNESKINHEILSTKEKNSSILQMVIKREDIREETVDSDNCEYTIDGKRKATLTRYLNDEDSVIIPRYIDEYEIESIDEDIFLYNDSLEFVKIPVEIASNVNNITNFEISEELSNDEYVIYVTTKEYSKQYLEYIKLTDEEKSKVEAIPGKFLVPLENVYSEKMQQLYGNREGSVNENIATIDLEETIPTSYDLREYIDIEIENQNPYGICYAYATLTGVETFITRKYGALENFSEIHTAVLSEQGGGGSFIKVYDRYLKKGYGPVDETYCSREDIYTGYTSDSTKKIIHDYCLNSNNVTNNADIALAKNYMNSLGAVPEYFVTDYVQFASVTGDTKKDESKKEYVKANRDQAKKHIMEYGSVIAWVDMVPKVNEGHYVLCDNNGATTTSAHLVSIIGWDDDFSKSNFPDSCGVTEDGAFLALNSWGNYWGEQGCFWISYQDYNVEQWMYGITGVEEKKVDINDTDITLSGTSFEYTGSQIKPTVTIKYNNANLVNGTDYTIEYSNNIELGTGEVKITGKGRYTGTITKTFTIQKGTIVINKEVYTGTYDRSEHGITITVESPINGATVKYGTTEESCDSDTSPTYIDVGEYTVYYKVTATNYNDVTGSEKVTINAKSISGVTIDLDNNQYEYDGIAKTPIPTVKDDSITLIQDQDYTVSYENNTNAGTGKVIITGTGNYEGTATKNFTIQGESMVVNAEGYTGTYDGNAYGITVTVTDPEDGATVKYGTTEGAYDLDTSPTYTNVGEYTVYYEVTATSYNDVTGNAKVTINAKSISGVTVDLDNNQYTYDGTAKTPIPTVKDDSTTLTQDQDYTISYENNTNVGTGTVIITGKGNYEGTETKEFTIQEASMIVNAEGYTETYDGNAHGITVTVTKPEDGATVKYGTTEVTYDLDASPTYTNVGEYTVYYKVTAANYSDVTGNAKVTINAKSISGVTVDLDNNQYIYDGTEITPIPTVKDGNTILIQDQDYTISYENNINIGTGTVIITGKGNYEGTATKNFAIQESPIIVSEREYTGTYDGNAHGITVIVINPADGATVKYGTTEGTYNLDASPTYTNVGEYTVYYKVTATNYSDVTGNVKVIINAKSISGVTVDLDNNQYIYDGTAKTPIPTVKDGSTILTQNQDYTISYENNTNIGTGTVIITGKGNYEGTATKDFTIQKSPIVVSGQEYTGTYDGNAHGITVTVANPTSGVTVKYGTTEGTYDLDASPTYTNVGEYTVYYKVTATDYSDVTGSAKVTINAKSISGVTADLDNNQYTYDGTAKTPIPTVKDGSTILTQNQDYTISYENNTNVGTGKVTIIGKGNYTGTTTKTFEIEKATPYYVAPSGISTVYGKTLKDVELPDGFMWEDDLSTLVGEVGENTFKCTYIPEDIENYNIITGIDVTIIVYRNLEIKFEENVTELEKINGTTYMRMFKDNISLKELQKTITSNGTVKIYNNNSEEITEENTIMTTGMKVKIETELENVEYIFIVEGDINGDGKVNSVDLLKLSRYLAGLDKEISDINLFAANVYRTQSDKNDVNSTDLLKIARVLAKLDSFSK